MIKSIHLLNFQNHRDTRLDFTEGVNAIVGFSDSGKTAVMRALNWVISNKPSGAEFQSHWGGETSVTIVLTDGQSIKRVRGKTANEYWLGDQCFKAFGQDVPQEIQSAFRLTDINQQSQMDSPFLLGDGWNSGEVAQYLNKVVRLDSIDRATSHVRKALLSAAQELKAEEVRLNSVQEALEKLGYLDAMQADVEALEIIAAEQAARRSRRQALQVIEDRVAAQQAKIRELSKAADGLQPAMDCLAGLTAIAAQKREVGRLRVLSCDLSGNTGAVQRAKKIIAAEARVLELLDEDKRITALDKQAGALQALRDKFAQQSTGLVALDCLLRETEKKFREKMPAVCPLCDQGVK